jgi:hypothetical protein
MGMTALVYGEDCKFLFWNGHLGGVELDGFIDHLEYQDRYKNDAFDSTSSKDVPSRNLFGNEPENYERTTGSFLTQFKNNINDIGSVIFGDNDVLQTPDVRNGFLEVNNNLTPLNSINSSRRGSISSFGNFDFGDNTTNPTYNGNDANRRNAASQSFFGNNTPSTGTTFDPGIFDTGLGVSNSNSGGFLASAFTSEAQRSGNSVSDFITPSTNGNSFTNSGYNVVNSTRSPNSQLGFSKGSQSTISRIGSIFFDI